MHIFFGERIKCPAGNAKFFTFLFARIFALTTKMPEPPRFVTASAKRSDLLGGLPLLQVQRTCLRQITLRHFTCFENKQFLKLVEEPRQIGAGLSG